MEIPGREDAQAAIQETLDTIYQTHRASSAELLTYAQNSTIESSYASQYEGCFIGAYVSGQALSLEDYTFSYASGAVHESSSRDQYNFDLKSGVLLSLGDIVADDAALEELILTQMSEDRESIESFTGSDLESVAEKALSSERTTGWYLDADGFHLYFDYYEIGSYAMGTSDYLVSYDLLEGILLEEYLPISALSSADREAVEIVSASEVSADEQNAAYGLTGSRECAITSITVYDLYIMSAAAAEENDGTGLLSDTVMLCYASVMNAEDQIYLDADDGQEIIIAYS